MSASESDWQFDVAQALKDTETPRCDDQGGPRVEARWLDDDEPDIAKGDMGVGPQPEAVTERVADLLWSEFNIEVEDPGIEVIDPEDDDVQVL